NAEIFIAGRARFALVRDAFAQQVERRGDAAGIQFLHRGDRAVERLAGHEARRELLRELVVANEPEDPRLVREIQHGGTKHQSRTALARRVAGLTMRSTGKSVCGATMLS